MKELESHPVAAFRLDDDTPFTDYSGYGRTGTRTETEVKGIPLTSTALYSQSLSSTRLAYFTIPGFIQQGNEDQSYSVSMTVYARGNFSFTHDDGYIWVSRGADGWRMSTGYVDDTTVETDAYIPQDNQKYHVVATFSRSSLVLFLNNERVIDYQIPDEHQSKQWHPTTDLWVITGDVLVSNVCFYNHALSGDDVKTIYEYNSRHVPEDVASAFGGQTIKVSTEVRKPSIEVRWDTAAEWNSGSHDQTVVDGDQLQAQRENDLTIEGKWDNSITFASPVPLSVFQSAYVLWSGKNADIELSLDGTTWITPNYGKNLSIMPTGFDPNDETLLVRVNFEAGDDEAYLDEFVFRAFTGPSANNHIDEREITYTNPAAVWDEQEPNSMIDFWGVHLDGGTVAIGPDANMAVNTIELWIKLDSLSDFTLSPNIASPTNTYVNGVLGASPVVGEWSVVHYTHTSDISDEFTITGDLTLGRVAVYPEVLTQDQISRIIQSYTGYPKTQLSASATIQIAESAAPATIYDHPWSNFSAPE